MVNGSLDMVRRLPLELQLLLTIIRTDDISKAREEARQLGQLHIDWDRFVHLAKQHRLYPVAASKLGQIDVIPEHVKQQLNQMFIQNTYRMLQLTAVMEKVCSELAAVHIEALVLKGPVIAEALYGDFSLRTSKDLDILVPEQRIEQAEAILLQLGFKPDEHTPRILNSLKRKKHHLGYTHPQNGVQVELHWRMSSGTYKEPAFTELWNRRQTTKKTTKPVYYLGQEDLFIYLVSHGARHAWFRLRWLNDIARMMRLKLQWDVVMKQLRQLDRTHVAGQALLLAAQLYQAPLNPACSIIAQRERARLLADEAIPIIAEYIDIMDQMSPEQYVAYFKRYNGLLLSTRQRLKQSILKLYPTDLDAEVLALPRWLHFMYFPLRPFLWYWRKKKQRITV
ncbi:nucleotidyltransferase domain-containing protein [Paenibacillus xylaniclasticus]|uniref:nucleotidyltransferase domain-containing protein n=1 Tax=Paenibacillus xylaniclasticus TaxID=588083 RepID=UPI000FDC2665|nr:MULTISPECIES: nucleotidyltransferase family protein [Paenibacillus]GFN29852.1 hypothetical protein PCURB6_01120 [Paenibacillus curdlanolyticus]